VRLTPEQLEYCGLASRSPPPRLWLPSLPLHLSLSSQSHRSAARASFYSYSIPSLCYFWGPLGLSNPENQKGERKRESSPAREKVPALLPSLALTPSPPTSDCYLRFLDPRFGRPAAAAAVPGAGKDWVFLPMEAWPDPFRPGRWSGSLTRSDSYWFK
jgi:hypothetical protein